MGRWQTRIQFGTYRGPSGPRYVPNWIRDLPSPIDCMYTKSLSAIYDLDFCSAILAHFLRFCPFDRCRQAPESIQAREHHLELGLTLGRQFGGKIYFGRQVAHQESVRGSQRLLTFIILRGIYKDIHRVVVKKIPKAPAVFLDHHEMNIAPN